MPIPHDFSSDEVPIVYHYTTLQAARAMVESQTIWLSEYTAMNDSSEFNYASGRLLSLLQRRAVPMDMAARLCVAITLEGMTNVTGMMISSLTARQDDLSQWRAYADNGGGCVIGLDARYLQHDAGVAIRTMVYEEAIADRMLCAGLTVVQNQYRAAPADARALVENARCLVADLFTIKHPCFEDEREVRISRLLIRDANGSLADVGGNRSGGGATPPLRVATRAGAFGATRYIALPLARTDASSAIVSIGFGPTMSSEVADTEARYFEARGLVPWRSRLPYRVT